MPPEGEGARDGRRPGWLRTTAFRVTLLHLALTLLGTAALSGVAWWATTGFAYRRLATDVEQDTNVLLRAARLGGIASVALSVEARVAADRTGTEYYLLAAPDGARLAGNLAQAPRATGWSTLRLRGGPGPETEVLALGTRLPDNSASLVVARDLSPVRDLEARLLGAAGWVGGTALLLGLLGGLVMGRGVARRAAAMEAALAAVEAGDIGRRLPARTGGDEFDRLAGRINAALDRLQELMATVRQVTDDVAHDLRTPLSRLRQRLEAAAAGRDADARGAVEDAIEECDRILGVFEALLRIAQVEGGGPRASFEPFDLSGVAETVAEVYAPAAEERRQTLEARIAPGVPAWGDRELATQMLANLVENAVRHGREGGRVEVALERASDGGATLTVADDGAGIPAAERGRVFRRFHRLDAARSSPGTGLGLALAKAVADLHGMSIALSDNAPGLRVAVSVPAPPSPRQDGPPR